MAGGNLIINYLPQNMTEAELNSMFAVIGPTENVKIMRDYKTGYSYGFGFVHFKDPDDAERAIQQLNGKEINNKRIKVSYARPSGDDIKETNLYITNLPLQYTEQDLDNLFGKYGTIVQKNILKHKMTGLPRGVAFVRFDKREEAQEAIRNLNGYVVVGGEKLNVRLAENHGKMKAAYYAGWQASIQNRGGGGGGMLNLMRGGRGGGGLPRVQRNSFYGTDQNDGFFGGGRNDGGFGAVKQEKFQQRYTPM